MALAWYESRLKPNARSKDGRWYCLYQLGKSNLPDATCHKRALNDRLALYAAGRVRPRRADSYRIFLASSPSTQRI